MTILETAQHTAGNYSSTVNNMANNSHSLSLASASTQYAYRANADCVNLGETGGTDPNLFMAWVKPASVAHMVICSHTTGFDDVTDMPEGGFEFSITTDGSGGYKPYVWLYQYRGSPPNFNPQIFTPSGTGAALGSWHHLAFYAFGVFPYTSSSVRFYIDGVYVETITKSNSGSFNSSGGAYSQVGSADFRVGVVQAEDTNYYGYWDGEIDELILTRASDTSDADAIVTAYFRSCNQSATGGLFHFNNALTDASGNGNTLTGVNSPTYAAAAYSCFSPKACMIL